MFYEDDLRNPGSRIGGTTLERNNGTRQTQVTSFASRLHQPQLPEIRTSQKLHGLTRSEASSGTPKGDRKNPPNKTSEQPVRGTYKGDKGPESPTFSQALLREAIARFSAYLKEERERYRPQGRQLNHGEGILFARFFSHELLRRIRVVALSGRLLSNPPFYEEAKALGLSVPDMTHKASATFLDVVVFNEAITDRKLFHALVHAAQAHVLGTQFFTELFVRGVIRSRSYSLAPMKAQAFALDARFAANPDVAFSVEEEIRSWMNEGRY